MKNAEPKFKYACEAYAAFGVDVEKALQLLDSTPLSLHCWQLDDVQGFENNGESLSGGIQTTGNFPGKARTPDELREDLKKALSYVPGKNKVNIHASYLESGGQKVDRDAIEPEHYSAWIDWAKEQKIGLDFNPTYFSHPFSADGYTLASADPAIRSFWIEHGKRCRKIAEAFGKNTGETCVTNLWVPDGEKDLPADTLSPRERLLDSLDQIYAEPIDKRYNVDSVESKLFGIGSESYVVGSHEFYMGYAMRKGISLTMDAGHFHPTELVSAKVSSMLLYLDNLLLHVSRPVRWDSDHVVAFDDETRAMMREVVKCGALNRVFFATDYFDASINRVIALALGARNAKKALLEALLTPVEQLKKLEAEGDRSSRLGIGEELKTLPLGDVWDYYCEKNSVLTGMDWLNDAKQYEKDVLLHR